MIKNLIEETKECVRLISRDATNLTPIQHQLLEAIYRNLQVIEKMGGEK